MTPASTPASTPVWTPSGHERERARYRRRQTVRSLLLSAASTVVLGGLLAFAVTRSPGWSRVRDSFFDLRIGRDSLSSIADAMLLNLKVSAVCGVLILVFGLVVAVLRTLPGPVFWPVRAAATAYVDLFRGLPLILVLLLVGFGVPGLRLQGLPGDVVFYGGAALVLTYTAYVAEVFRAGIESIHPSQSAAARSLGLSAGQTMRHVVLPQAVRRVVPALLNDLISLQKDSGLVSVLGAIDAVAAAQIYTAKTFNFTPYVVAGGLFVLITVPQTRLTDWLTRRWWS